MLQRIVKIISSSSYRFDGGTLYCDNVTITDTECISYLEENNILENSPNQQNLTRLELNLARLNSVGYYENIAKFVQRNKYTIPSREYYIEEIKCYNVDNNEFINKYMCIISLINSIKNVAKHKYTEEDENVDNAFIFSEDKGLLLPFIYDAQSVSQITTDDIKRLKETITIFSEKEDSDKKRLFINELIDFLTSNFENERFNFLLSHIEEFTNRVNNAYQYYIRNFSYNKLKAELDNKALEYLKSIQSVINEAQTKLIAIPTAFVLAISNMNFLDIWNSKNIGIICSLFIFSSLIELFIKNQKSTLVFINHNIKLYKNSFKTTNEIIQESFEIVDKEWEKQNARITIIRCITWGIPISLLLVLCFFYLIQKQTNIDTIIYWVNQIWQK